MQLLNQFIEMTSQKGANLSNAYIQNENGFDMIAFGEKADKDEGLTYNIVFAFYDDEDIVEVYIRKHIIVDDKQSILEKLNQYNAVYRGMSFFLDGEMVCEKSYCTLGGNIDIAIRMMTSNFEIVQSLFSVFKHAQ